MIAIIYSYKINESLAKVNEAVRIKQFLSYQHHDWMNDVQVILGYLALKKTDHLRSYLEQQIQKANSDRLITQLRYAPLVIELITLPRRYLQWKMSVKVQSIAEYTLQEEKILLSIIDHVFPWLENQLQNITMDLGIKVHIKKDEKIKVTISIVEELSNRLDFILMNDLDEMRKTIRKRNGDFLYNQERNEITIKL